MFEFSTCFVPVISQTPKFAKTYALSKSTIIFLPILSDLGFDCITIITIAYRSEYRIYRIIDCFIFKRRDDELVSTLFL